MVVKFFFFLKKVFLRCSQRDSSSEEEKQFFKYTCMHVHKCINSYVFVLYIHMYTGMCK